MIRSWVSAQYLGHQNLKKSLDMLKRAMENQLVYPGGGIAAVTGADYRGEGTYGACAIIQVGATFCYRIEDVAYLKGKGLIAGLIPKTSSDMKAASSYDVTAGYFRAGVILIDSAGTYSFVLGAQGIAGKASAVQKLIDVLDNDDLESKAIVAVYIIGDGSAAFLSSASLLVGTNLDVFGGGGMAVSSGLSTDGLQMLGAL